ncbi:hypothetical protein [Paenibacillus sp. HJGM_3]|uniref:hypothetical protein n=1 Tax=Paenibacillus sp. HJGM_3 TaxID=3379816 RepID=UPI00385F26D8
MSNRRRGERLTLDEVVELSLLYPESQQQGPLLVDEMSYEFARKYGVHLNLLLTGLRFKGNVDLSVGQEISFQVPDQHGSLKGEVAWKKQINASDYMYGIKVPVMVNRRKNERVDLEESLEMTLIKPEHQEHDSFTVEEISYGLGRKHGVHLRPLATGLRFSSNLDLPDGQEITFQVPTEEEVLKGTIVWKERKSDGCMHYGVQLHP